MNCIFLLLLLCCCGGWGSTGCAMAENDNGCREGGRGGNAGRRDSGRRDSGDRQGDCGCKQERSGRKDDDCGCMQERPGRKDDDCGCMQERPGRRDNDCGCAQNERESCDVPGMIPPPWQEYPAFPRRDNREDCDSDK